MKLGYNRSLRILDELEQTGIIGPPNPNGQPGSPVLVPDEQALLLLLQHR